MNPEYKKSLAARFWKKVNKTDECWEWIGLKGRGGYGRISVYGKHRAAHRVAWMLSGNDLKDDASLDHLCFNKSCVNPSHLRISDKKLNAENRPGPNANSSTGHWGVTYIPSRGVYEARVGHNGKRLWAGYHQSLEEADKAAREMRNRVFSRNDIDR